MKNQKNGAAAPRLSLLSVALSAALSSGAWAQQVPQMPDVRIEAGRLQTLPQPTGWLNAAQINTRRSSTSDTASLLEDVPGVSLYSAGGVSSLPVIHGMADDRLRIKVDGMDLIASCPNHMNPALSYLDPNAISSLQVYAGITPVSLGGDSIGGTIIANTRQPQFATSAQEPRIASEVSSYARSNGNADSVSFSTSYATESLSLGYSGAQAQSDNYKAAKDFKTTTATGRPGHTLPLDEVGSSAYKTRNQTFDIAMRGDKHLVEAKFGFQDVPYQLYPNQRMDMLSNKQDSINLRYLGQRDWGVLEARAYSEKVTHYMDFGADKQFTYGTAPGIVAPGMPMYTDGKTTGASVKADIELASKDVLRIGSDYQSYKLNDWWPPSPGDLTGMLTNGVQATYGGMAPNTFWNINNGKRTRLGVFGEWEGRLTDQWTSLLGARTERVMTDTGNVQGYNNVYAGYTSSAAAFNSQDHKRTDHNLDLTALARHIPSAQETFEFGYAQKTRSPNLYERYSWSQNSMALIMNNFVGDGNGYLGDQNLKPEVAHTISATGDWHTADKSSGVKATPYYTHVENYVDAVRCTGSGSMMNALCSGTANNTTTNQFVQMQYANQTARIFGLDLSGHTPVGRNSLGNWGVKGVLNYTNGRNTKTGDALYNVMPLNARFTLTQKLAGWDNSLGVVMVQAKDNVSDVRNEVKTPGYSLVNLRASHTWQQLRVDFGVENVFNKFYYMPQGGAYVGQGMTMSTNGIPWGTAVPGMGRSFYVGMNYKF